MADEAPNRSARKTDSGDAQGGRGDEHSPLQARAAFIKNWSWESIIGLNRGSCERGRAQHGHNSETHERVSRQWEETRQEELTLADTLDFLFRCHRSAPFLFFNGNTFAEVAPPFDRCSLRRPAAGTPPRSRFARGALCGRSVGS